MPRVHEVAKQLGISSREVLDHLDQLGEPRTSHASSIDEALARRIRVRVEDGRGDITARRVAEQLGATPRPDERPKKKRGFLAHLAELPLLLLFAFGIAIVIKTFLVQAFFIPSGSMTPTLHVGDRVLVEKISYRLGGPDRGDVVVFEKSVFGDPLEVPWYEDVENFVRELLGLPTGTREDYIKRVVAVGGDTVRYTGSPRRLYVNGEVVDQSYLRDGLDRRSPTLTARDCSRLDMEKEGRACRVPAGKVFVMGDNRGNSEDSRILGPIDGDKIVGRAFVIIWPLEDLGGL